MIPPNRKLPLAVYLSKESKVDIHVKCLNKLPKLLVHFFSHSFKLFCIFWKWSSAKFPCNHQPARVRLAFHWWHDNQQKVYLLSLELREHIFLIVIHSGHQRWLAGKMPGHAKRRLGLGKSSNYFPWPSLAHYLWNMGVPSSYLLAADWDVKQPRGQLNHSTYVNVNLTIIILEPETPETTNSTKNKLEQAQDRDSGNIYMRSVSKCVYLKVVFVCAGLIVFSSVGMLQTPHLSIRRHCLKPLLAFLAVGLLVIVT